MRRYIAFEGIDGAGKSTTLRAVLRALRSRGEFVFGLGAHAWLDIEATRVIIDTREGRAKHAPDDIVRAFLTDRLEYSAHILPPILRRYDVIGDRSVLSDAVYLEALYGSSAEDYLTLATAQGVKLPDHIVFMDVDPAVASERVTTRGRQTKHYENAYDLSKVRGVYKRLLSPGGWIAARTDYSIIINGAARDKSDVISEALLVVAGVFGRQDMLELTARSGVEA